MSKNHAIIIQFVLPLTTFYRSGAQKSNVYKRDAFVTSWRFHNRAWQPRRHDRLPETSGTLWIHLGALTNQRCSLITGCGIRYRMSDTMQLSLDMPFGRCRLYIVAINNMAIFGINVIYLVRPEWIRNTNGKILGHWISNSCWLIYSAKGSNSTLAQIICYPVWGIG